MKKLIVFDLDGTLAPSKSSIDAEMSSLLHDLIGVVKVAVISGGAWRQFEKQVLSKLPHDESLARLFILPTCGTQFFQYVGEWKRLYAEDFTDEEKEKIKSSLNKAVEAAAFPVEKTWGEAIEDRGSQLTYSALGQQAPLEEKEKWDPDFAKRKKIKSILDTLIPQFSVRLGGATSIDVTKLGIDKAYRIRKLRDILGISLKEMIFIGDALFIGGKDYPAERQNASLFARYRSSLLMPTFAMRQMTRLRMVAPRRRRKIADQKRGVSARFTVVQCDQTTDRATLRIMCRKEVRQPFEREVPLPLAMEVTKWYSH